MLAEQVVDLGGAASEFGLQADEERLARGREEAVSLADV